jgi:hypothetical protein
MPLHQRTRSRSRSISGGVHTANSPAKSRNPGLAGERGNGAHSKTRPCERAVTSARVLGSEKQARVSVDTEALVKRLSSPIVKRYRDRRVVGERSFERQKRREGELHRRSQDRLKARLVYNQIREDCLEFGRIVGLIS